MKETKRIYEQVYEILDRFPVSDGDCGKYCGKICCCYIVAGEEESGMELLPGEEEVFPVEAQWVKPRFLSGAMYDFPPEWGQRSGCIQIRCLMPCVRHQRPVNCRLFPFSIYSENKKYYLALIEENNGYKCPLVQNPNSINPTFIRSAKEAAGLLLEIPKLKQLVDWDSANTDPASVRLRLDLEINQE